MDKKLDRQVKEALPASDEEEFRIGDIRVIISNRGFWLIALLCLLFYAAVFPFYKYGPDLMVNKFGVSEEWAGLLPSLVPFGTMLLTPLFGSLYDNKGRGASIMILGALFLVVVHAIFFLPFVTSVVVAFFNVFSLYSIFRWTFSQCRPSAPKSFRKNRKAPMPIFWIQNIGFMGESRAGWYVLDRQILGLRGKNL